MLQGYIPGAYAEQRYIGGGEYHFWRRRRRRRRLGWNQSAAAEFEPNGWRFISCHSTRTWKLVSRVRYLSSPGCVWSAMGSGFASTFKWFITDWTQRQKRLHWRAAGVKPRRACLIGKSVSYTLTKASYKSHLLTVISSTERRSGAQCSSKQLTADRPVACSSWRRKQKQQEQKQ